MNIPILNGVYVADGAIRVSQPVNLVPVPTQSGVSDWSLRPAEGIESFAEGEGVDRGAIVWENTHYRVSGTKLVSVSAAGAVTVIGDIPGTGRVRMAFSFDYLAIAANGNLYYFDGSTIAQVTDPDVGTVLDVVWIAGYFVVTDGVFIAVSDLSDPFSFSPVKYGSTDVPDPVQTIRVLGKELIAASRHQIDVFQNVGGTGFPFSIVLSATISKGALGRDAACVFGDAIAFVGSGLNEGLNEAPSVYLGRNAQFIKIATREIDDLLLQYTEEQLAETLLEQVVDRGSQFLYVHLPDRTVVYDATATGSVGDKPAAERPVWFTLVSGLDGFSRYRARNIVRFGDAWIVGDPTSTAIGRWSTKAGAHYGVDVRWEFGTLMLRNEGRGAIIDQLDLVALTGESPAGADATISTSRSLDGVSWGPDRTIRAGKRGETAKSLTWLQLGEWRGTCVRRFRGDTRARITIQAIEAQITGLKY